MNFGIGEGSALPRVSDNVAEVLRIKSWDKPLFGRQLLLYILRQQRYLIRALDPMYLTAVWKRFWRLQSLSVELEVALPMTGLNT